MSTTTKSEHGPGGGNSNGEQAAASFRVLLVEDNVDAADLMVLMLAREGMTAVAVGSVRDAIAEYKRERPHAIVSDLMLPDENGGVLAEFVRQNDDQDTHLLALSGRHDGEKMAKAAGFDRFILKPVEVGQLVAELRAGRTQ